MTDIKELKLIPPNDPRVNNAIAPFVDEMLKDEGIKDRKELVEAMFFSMEKYHGIGLSANQVGLPFNMFVVGGHPQIENGMKLACFNPMIIESSEETIMMKEGCLTYPFLFLNIIRPRKITLKYTDEDGELKEAKLDGMMSRIVQHEYDHMLGRNFTERASKLKIDAAMKKRDKMLKRIKKYQEAEAKMNKA